jgi:hypothetical protein
MAYFDDLRSAKERLVCSLEERQIESRYLRFGGEGDKPERAPTVPTDARSEFLANRAMGDWAERILAAAIRASRPEWQVSHYGSAERMAAGDRGFREFYLGGLEEVRKYGKRPDLLIFPRDLDIPDDISNLSFDQVDPLVRNSLAALEVRSSKFEALKYMAVRAQEKVAGKSSGRDVPSFTVKVEDLKIVYRWVERYSKPQAYVQVFFDSVFAINVLRIFQIIADGGGFAIETPAKSQLKATIMIPITNGLRIGVCDQLPKFEVEERVTRLGRHDAYVKPLGGTLRVETGPLAELLRI